MAADHDHDLDLEWEAQILEGLEGLLRSGNSQDDGGSSLYLIAYGPRPPLVGPPSPPDRIVLVSAARRVAAVARVGHAAVSEIQAALRGGGGGGPPPASKASIEAMPTVKAAAAEEEEMAECAVCLDELGGLTAKEMPCGHRFHGVCIEKWLGLHGSCPVCRFQMPAEEEAAIGDSVVDDLDDEDVLSALIG